MKKSQGFTLIEFMIVLVIICVLGVVSIPVYKSYLYKDQIIQHNKDIGDINEQEVYLAE